MKQYLDNLRLVEEKGATTPDRTGTGRHRYFSPPEERYSMSEGLPLVTTREIKPNAVIDELLWFISGSVDINKLKYKFFWKKWAVTQADVEAWLEKWYPTHDKDSEEYQRARALAESRIDTIGKMYGHAWRKAPMQTESVAYMPKRELEDFPTPILDKAAEDFITHDGRQPFKTGLDILQFLYDEKGSESEQWFRDVITPLAAQEYWKTYDQLNELIINLKANPFSSRHRVMASIPEWTAFEHMSPQENTLAGRGCLTPCHTFFQCFVKPGENGGKHKLSLKLYMSSNDMPVGRVYNIAQYSILLCMIAQCVDMEADEFVISTGDGHIYSNQHEGVSKQVTREPLPRPKLWLNPEIKHLFDFKPEDIRIEGYEFHPEIKYPVSV